MVIFKQVLPIAVAMMIYLQISNTLRGIYFLLTVKTCEGFTSLFPSLPWIQAQASCKMKIELLRLKVVKIPLEKMPNNAKLQCA